MTYKMDVTTDATQVAAALKSAIGLLYRRLRATRAPGELTLAETSALSRLDRMGSAMSAGLAKLEQISPQSMGATLGALEARGLIQRRPHESDGRQSVISPTPAGLELLRGRRAERVHQIADALTRGFTEEERARLLAVAPLIERLAHIL